MIPENLVRTRLDRRVNRAYELAQGRDRQEVQGRRYVWCATDRVGDDDPIYISYARPLAHLTDGWVIVVDPAGFAVSMKADAEEP